MKIVVSQTSLVFIVIIQHVVFWRKDTPSNNKEGKHCNYLMIWIGDKMRDIERYILNVEHIRGR